MFNSKNHPILNASPLAERTLSPASADPFPNRGEVAEPERGWERWRSQREARELQGA